MEKNKSLPSILSGKRTWLTIISVFLICQLLSGQQMSISGKVTDYQQVPLKGVNVGVLSGNASATTDMDGHFEILVDQAGVTITFSQNGYFDIEIAWDGVSDMIVRMFPDLTVDHRNSLLRRLGKNSDLVKANNLGNMSVSNPADIIQGRISGVNIANYSGAPGEEPFINIRGLNTYLFNHDPVILVDGVPVLSMSDINFSDIKQIQVVKNMATAALYGSKGSNGLVLISTRNGLPGKNSVDFNASFGMASPPPFLDMLNGQQGFDLMQEINAPLAGTPDDKSSYWSSSDHLSGVNINTGDLQNNDWQEELFRMAVRQNYSLAFSGGSNMTSFRIAGSYQNNEGIVDPSDFSRMTMSFNLDKMVNDRFTFNTGLYLSKSKKNLVDTENSAEKGGVILSALAYPSFLPAQDTAQMETGGYFINPLRPEVNSTGANIHGVENEFNRTSVLIRFSGNYRIAEGLTLNITGASNLKLSRQNMFMSTKHVYIGRKYNGLAFESGQEKHLWDTKGFLSYDKSSSGHKLNAIAGGGLSGSHFAWNEARGIDFTSDDIQLVSGTPTIPYAASNVNDYRTRSWLAALDYSFENKYFIGFNVRGDGSSRFSESIEVISDELDPETWEIKKEPVWGTFLGAHAAWNLSRESFLEEVDLVSNLTLQASYGKAGNDGGNFAGRVYPYYWQSPLTGFNPDEDYTAALFPGIGFPIPNLQTNTWESSSEINAGIDLGFVKNRIQLSAGYFKRTTADLIMLDWSDSTYKNTGELITNGIEASIKTLNVSSENLKWITQLHFSKLNSNVEKIGGSGDPFELGYNGISNVIKTGEPVFAFWGYKTDGLFQNQSEVENNASLPGTGPGDVKYINQNGDNTIDERDRVVIGDPNPEMIIGIDNTLRLGNIEVSLFFFGMIGHDILNLTRMQTEGLNDWVNQSTATLDRWTGEGTSDEVPRAVIGNNNIQLSDRFIEGGTFVKLKYLTIGYFLPDNLISRIGMERCKIYLTGQNLLTFTGYSGYDPEVSIMGPLSIDFGAYPNARYFGGGIHIGF